MDLRNNNLKHYNHEFNFELDETEEIQNLYNLKPYWIALILVFAVWFTLILIHGI